MINPNQEFEFLKIVFINNLHINKFVNVKIDNVYSKEFEVNMNRAYD